jgi:hypothetical protein
MRPRTVCRSLPDLGHRIVTNRRTPGRPRRPRAQELRLHRWRRDFPRGGALPPSFHVEPTAAALSVDDDLAARLERPLAWPIRSHTRTALLRRGPLFTPFTVIPFGTKFGIVGVGTRPRSLPRHRSPTPSRGADHADPAEMSGSGACRHAPSLERWRACCPIPDPSRTAPAASCDAMIGVPLPAGGARWQTDPDGHATRGAWATRRSCSTEPAGSPHWRGRCGWRADGSSGGQARAPRPGGEPHDPRSRRSGRRRRLATELPLPGSGPPRAAVGVGDASALRARGGPAATALPSTPGRTSAICAGDEQDGLGVAARTRVAFHVERSHRLCPRRSTWNASPGWVYGTGRHPGIASPRDVDPARGDAQEDAELVAPRRREMAGGSSAFAPAPRSTEPQAARAASAPLAGDRAGDRGLARHPIGHTLIAAEGEWWRSTWNDPCGCREASPREQPVPETNHRVGPTSSPLDRRAARVSPPGWSPCRATGRRRVASVR